MDVSTNKVPAQMSLFQVFLRLRPPMQQKQNHEPWLLVEPATSASEDGQQEVKNYSTHITLQPPNDSRKRAIERFGFTKVFHENASQLDVFEEIGAMENIHNVLKSGRDGLIATLGVTGSGKSHTILGTKSHRGLTQMSLDVLFRSIGSNIRGQHHPDMPIDARLITSLQANDASESQIIPATAFLENTFASENERGRFSRAQTPMAGIGSRAQTPLVVSPNIQNCPGFFPSSPDSVRTRTSQAARSSMYPQVPEETGQSQSKVPWRPPHKTRPSVWDRLTPAKKPAKRLILQEMPAHNSRKPPMPRPSTFAQEPHMAEFAAEVDPACDYAVVVSMYEVYNDRIFDLLSSTASSAAPMSTRAGALQKGLMRRPLLFKNTELSQDRKVVAGLKKVVCSSYDEAIMVLEAGLLERRVAGTGSNSASSRSHGFFCIEVKKKLRGNDYAGSVLNQWQGGTLSIVDLAGSERARNAKTTGSTLAEAGKINESLMYLGQCLQVQSDCQHDGTKPIVPFRQCKLTELLFSNSFPTTNNTTHYRPPQKAVMIVTADAQGDFNATSQILRYSALAREVTVPRVPSVTEAMRALKGRTTPIETPQSYFSAQELEQARHEINRLAEECDALVVKMTEEEIKRTEAELRLQVAEERVMTIEQTVREECWQEMEALLEQEKIRWRAALNEERFNSQEFMDEKIEIIEKNASFNIHEDNPADQDRIDELERENDLLRSRLAAMEREANNRSPTKKKATIKTPGKSVQESPFEAPRIASVQNAFLTGLRETEKDSLVMRTVIKQPQADGEENQAPIAADMSPRKLSLRNGHTSVVADTLPPATPATIKKKRILKSKKWEVDNDAF